MPGPQPTAWFDRQHRHAKFPPRAAEWQRPSNFSLSTLSELYIENRKRGEFFLYIFAKQGVVHTTSSMASITARNSGDIASFGGSTLWRGDALPSDRIRSVAVRARTLHIRQLVVIALTEIF